MDHTQTGSDDGQLIDNFLSDEIIGQDIKETNDSGAQLEGVKAGFQLEQFKFNLIVFKMVIFVFFTSFLYLVFYVLSAVQEPLVVFLEYFRQSLDFLVFVLFKLVKYSLQIASLRVQKQ